MEKQPLFLPRGSVRALLVIILTIWILTLVTIKIDVPQIITAAWSGALGWYFGGKLDDIKRQSND